VGGKQHRCRRRCGTTTTNADATGRRGETTIVPSWPIIIIIIIIIPARRRSRSERSGGRRDDAEAKERDVDVEGEARPPATWSRSNDDCFIIIIVLSLRVESSVEYLFYHSVVVVFRIGEKAKRRERQDLWGAPPHLPPKSKT
jgi:hypothetical protein